MATPLATFGPGILIVQRTDIANSPVVNIGYSQSLSIEISANLKELYGQNQYALVVAAGTKKVATKMKAATLSALAWNAVFFGETFQSGGIIWNIDESNIVPSTPYTVTVTNAATFDADLGVKYSVGGLPLQRVAAGSEAVGKYSVTQSGGNKGKYVFAAADAAAVVLITYSSTTASGQTLPITNKPIGFTPTWQLDYYTNLNQPAAKPFAVRLNSLVSGKITPLNAQLEDYTMPEFEASAFADNSGNVGKFIFPEVS